MRKIMAVAGLALGVSAASGQTFYATNNLAFTNGYTSGGDQLITYDFFNAAGWSAIGEIVDQSGRARGGLGGLDFDGTGTVLYAADSFGAFPGEILTINVNTAQATVLGRAPAAMNDLAWDPITNTLYGSDGAGNLYSGLENPGSATLLGNFGIGSLEVGLAFDSRGNIYVHDLISDGIYVGSAGNLTSLSLLHQIPYNSNFSQGLFVDWHSGDLGYHGALNGSALTSENYTFGTVITGGGYGPLASTFPVEPTTGLPQVEVGDLTRPIPTPGSLALLAIGGLAAARRRR